MYKILEQMPLEQLVLRVEQLKAEPKSPRHAVIVGRHIEELEAVIRSRQAHSADDVKSIDTTKVWQLRALCAELKTSYEVLMTMPLDVLTQKVAKAKALNAELGQPKPDYFDYLDVIVAGRLAGQGSDNTL